jgi:hypothetical protein
VNIRHGLAASAGVATAVALGIALTSAAPAHAVGPPPDGTYSFDSPGVSGVTWLVTALCDQVNGSRYYKDYSNPDIQADFCSLNIVSTTDEKISHSDAVQNFSGRARLAGGLWTFQVGVPTGITCSDGSTGASTETYAFDDTTLAGTHTTLHGAVCGLQPEMKKQAFSLHPTGPPPFPIQRYPLQCNNVAFCS